MNSDIVFPEFSAFKLVIYLKLNDYNHRKRTLKTSIMYLINIARHFQRNAFGLNYKRQSLI